MFGAAYNITTDADSALGIFDNLVVILNVDVNVSGMNSDVAVSLQCTMDIVSICCVPKTWCHCLTLLSLWLMHEKRNVS